MVSQKDMENRNLKSRIDSMQAEIEQNSNRIAHLSEVKEQKDFDIQATNQQLGKEQATASQLKY